MNVVLIISDSFRRDHLSCYGQGLARTPRLEQLAQESYIFENAYLASFPTVPNRHDIMTGKCTFTYAGWQPLPTQEVTLQDVLGSVGINTMLVADTPHLVGRGFNYQRGFGAFEWIRGQENDHYHSSPREVALPCSPEKIHDPHYTMLHYLRNVSRRRFEANYFAPQTMAKAAEWLEENAHQGPFFLWVDTFDPHEPWDPPQHYVDLYDPGYEGEEITYPKPGPCSYLTGEELNHCRALYAGEVTMVDHWVGRLLDRIDALGLRDNTAVIFTSDHGKMLGEHGLIGMAVVTDKGNEAIPKYQEMIRIPLLIRLPGTEGGTRIPALVQPPDLMPTILELCGVITTAPVAGTTNVQILQCGMYKKERWHFDPSGLHGQSLVPLMRGEQERIRNFVVSSSTLTVPSPAMAKCAIITENGWCLFYSGELGPIEGNARVGRTSVCDVKDAIIDSRPELYYLPDDPKQENNLIGERRVVAEGIHSRYVEYLESIGTEETYLQYRRRLFS